MLTERMGRLSEDEEISFKIISSRYDKEVTPMQSQNVAVQTRLEQ